ncbi:MAG: chorismate mutase [Beijerinckiaceae bacterium]|nr:chorismate mutase [Beijerinckiaceae bacterium]MCZ8298953.1 chorismate mutase [Beijerinckiaceae bacterium]
MSGPVPADMGEVRAAIDALDRQLVPLLGRRLALIRRASELKATPDQARVPWRIEDVAQKVRAEAEAAGFDADLAEAIWRDMMEHCIRFEENRLAARQREAGGR